MISSGRLGSPLSYVIICGGRGGAVTDPGSPHNCSRRNILDMFTIEIVSPDNSQPCNFIHLHVAGAPSVADGQGESGGRWPIFFISQVSPVFKPCRTSKRPGNPSQTIVGKSIRMCVRLTWEKTRRPRMLWTHFCTTDEEIATSTDPQ